MDVILYNPISRNGKNDRLVLKLARKLRKKGRSVSVKSLLEIPDISAFLAKIDDRARFIIVGGDGTLNRLANEIKDFNIPQDIYLYRAGTGNDFARSLKSKKRLVSIKEHLYNLPKVTVEGKRYSFLNGVGIGLDGYIVHLVNESKFNKNKGNYLTKSLYALRKFQPIKSRVTIDGKVIETENTLLVSVMNSKFLGGGMRMAPHASREDDNLDVVIIKNVSRIKLFLLVPTIYLGWHRFIKKHVEIHKGKDINIEFLSPSYVQIDGESIKEVTEISAKGGEA